jgi:hypothetical protein
MTIQTYYKLYLKPEDLQGKTATVKISKVYEEQHYNLKARKDIACLVIEFEGKMRALILNPTQADDVTRVTGEDTDENKWIGHFISISPVKGYSGKTTIKVTKPIRAEGLFGATVGKNIPAEVKHG